MPKDNKFSVQKLDGTSMDEAEPVFVLRGQDVFASWAVRQYALTRWDHDRDAETQDEILAIAKRMEEWPGRRWPD